MSIEWFDATKKLGGEFPLYEASMNGIFAEVNGPREDGDRWFWQVRASVGRCAFPEVYSCGLTDTEVEAKVAAEGAMTRADASYPVKSRGE